MSKQELTALLEMISNASEEKREELISKYEDSITNYFYKIPRNERTDLIQNYNALLFDMGLITRFFLTPEEREKRRLAAQSKPKFSPTEETIRQIFMQIFNEEPYWLKGKKAFSKFRNQGISIAPPQFDSNLNEGYLSLKPKGYSICLASGLPYFYISIQEGVEDIFLYLQKADEQDPGSIELNQKAIAFLVQIQKSFASRTPDTIYLSSYFDEEDATFLWTETSANFDNLIYFTDRITSGHSNIVSLSDGAIELLKQRNNYSYHQVKEMVEARFLQNGNPTTIQMINGLREQFDVTFHQDNSQKYERS